MPGFKKLKKITAVIVLFLVALLAVVLLSVSSIARYMINNYGKDYIGRKIYVEKLRINLLNGKVSLRNVVLFEADDQTHFVDIGSLQLNTSVPAIIRGSYEVTEVYVGEPVIRISQDGYKFNFDDMIAFFSDTASVPDPDTTSAEELRYSVENILIEKGKIIYENAMPRLRVEVDSIKIALPLISSHDPVLQPAISFSLASGGEADLGIIYNSMNGDYTARGEVKQLNLSLLYPYLHDYIYVNSLDGTFSASLSLSGNANRPSEISAAGNLALENLAVVDTTGLLLASAGRIAVAADTINTPRDFYYFSEIAIERPFVRFAMYDDGYNFDRLLVPSASADSLGEVGAVEDYANIFRMMADYVSDYFREYKISNYKANKVILTQGEIIYTDYTLEDKFTYRLDSLEIISENLNSASDRINVKLSSRLNNKGSFSGTMAVNPDGFSEMEILYSIRGIMLSDINPYSVYYVATPFIDGRFTFENEIYIRDRQLKSENRLVVEKVMAGAKVKNNTAMNIPVRLAIAILRDLNGDIRLSVPVEGDLDDPDYKWGKALWGVFKNLIIKAAVAPYRLMSGLFGGKEEDYQQLNMRMLQQEVSETNQTQLLKLAEALKSKPELGIELTQMFDAEAEKELLAVYLAKAKFLQIADSALFGLSATEKISALPNRDTVFNAWLNKQPGIAGSLTSVFEKSEQLVGRQKLSSLALQLPDNRNNSIRAALVAAGISPERIRFEPVAAYAEQQSTGNPVFKIGFFALE